MFKRSRSVGLLLMASTPIVLTACNQPTHLNESSPQAYSTVQSCVNDGRPRSDCEKSFATAQNEREKNAPRFATQQECEQQFEQCGPNQSGGVFMPLLAGYMVGRLMNSNTPSTGMGSSLYRSKNGDISRLNHTSEGKAHLTPVRSASAPTASRGGFGGRSYARSMGG